MKAPKAESSTVSAPNAGHPTRAKKKKCRCHEDFQVRLARPAEYQAFKNILNKGRHPAFIGRSTYARNSNNGGTLFFEHEGIIIGVSMINPHYGILTALNVLPAHRGHGLGSAMVRFLIPNFVRCIESKIEFFERLGYIRIGKMKTGIRLNTQIMARAALFDLAGNLKKAWS